MSSSPPTVVCPQCSREVPRFGADPDGGWEKCDQCNGIFLVVDEKSERPSDARINVIRERDRLTLVDRPRTSVFWRLALGLATLCFLMLTVIAVVAMLGLMMSPAGPILFGCLTYCLAKFLFRDENYCDSMIFDDEGVRVCRRLFPFAFRTLRIPMKEIVQLESRSLQEKNPEGERLLLFHYLDSRKRERIFSVYPASQAEEHWILDELHEFLKSTPNGSPILPFAHFMSHPSESLSVRAVGDTMFVRIYCPRCGMRINVADLDLASDEAVCRQTNCGERFVWWELPPRPEPAPEEIRRLRRRYESYSDVRAIHFSDAADPYEAVFEPRRPFSPRLPRRLALSRPSIVLDKDRLTIRVKSVKDFGVVQWFFFSILAVFFLLACSAALGTVYLEGTLLIAKEYEPGPLFGIAIGFGIFASLTFLLHRSMLNFCSEYWGRWTVSMTPSALKYQRLCLWNRCRLEIPLEKLRGFYVVFQPIQPLSSRPERFVNHFVRFDIGRKSYYFPCGSEEHRNWVASEIVDYLAVRGWDAGNGTVCRNDRSDDR